MKTLHFVRIAFYINFSSACSYCLGVLLALSVCLKANTESVHLCSLLPQKAKWELVLYPVSNNCSVQHVATIAALCNASRRNHGKHRIIWFKCKVGFENIAGRSVPLYWCLFTRIEIAYNTLKAEWREPKSHSTKISGNANALIMGSSDLFYYHTNIQIC